MIGNFVNRKYYNPLPLNSRWELEKCEVIAIRPQSIIVKLKNGSHTMIDYWEGIPLNEDWMVAFGFKKKTNSYVIYPLTIKKQGSAFFYSPGQTQIHYVHELQNLYYCLTNKILTI